MSTINPVLRRIISPCPPCLSFSQMAVPRRHCQTIALCTMACRFCGSNTTTVFALVGDAQTSKFGNLLPVPLCGDFADGCQHVFPDTLRHRAPPSRAAGRFAGARAKPCPKPFPRASKSTAFVADVLWSMARIRLISKVPAAIFCFVETVLYQAQQIFPWPPV